MTTPLYPTFRKRIQDATARIIHDQVTPWIFLNAGPPFKAKQFTGREIFYQGLEFEGSPREVFWGQYIDPFLEALAIEEIDLAILTSNSRNVDTTLLLPEVQKLLIDSVQKVFESMAEVDLRLRSRGMNATVSLRPVEVEIRRISEFIEERIRCELAMCKPGVGFNSQDSTQPNTQATTLHKTEIEVVEKLWDIDPDRREIFLRSTSKLSRFLSRIFNKKTKVEHLYRWLQTWLASQQGILHQHSIFRDEIDVDGVPRKYQLINDWSIRESDLSFLSHGPLVAANGKKILIPAYSLREKAIIWFKAIAAVVGAIVAILKAAPFFLS